MEQSSSSTTSHQYSGFWFICKYCQHVFRDKLELFCHQVNSHPEYREELNGQRGGSVVNSGTSHEMIYADPNLRSTTTLDMKRNSTNFLQSLSTSNSGSSSSSSAQQQQQQQQQQQSTTSPSTTVTPSWYPPSAGHIPNHVDAKNYYNNPVEYYVVLPNQSQGQSQAQSVITATASATNNPVVNIPAPRPLVINQQVAHAASSLASCQQQQQLNQRQQQQQQFLHQQTHEANLITLRNVGENDWSKVGSGGGGGGGDTSESDTGSSNPATTLTNTKDDSDNLDYFCWKCKVKFGNATAYIAHSSSCFPPSNNNASSNSNDMYGNSSEADTRVYNNHDDQSRERLIQPPRKRGKKGRGGRTVEIEPEPEPEAYAYDIDQDADDSNDYEMPIVGSKRRKNSGANSDPDYVPDYDENPPSAGSNQQAPTYTTLTTVKPKPRNNKGRGGRGKKNQNQNQNQQQGQGQANNSEAERKQGTNANSNNGTEAGKPASAAAEADQKPGSGNNRCFPCAHCGFKFNTCDKLTSHLLSCKMRKSNYDSYEYKCIKCGEAFDIYLNYKRHIAIHTGEVRYS